METKDNVKKSSRRREKKYAVEETKEKTVQGNEEMWEERKEGEERRV